MEKKKIEPKSKEFEDFKKEINRLIELISDDAEKFYLKNNNAAGLRLRKGYKAIKAYAEKTHKEVLKRKESQHDSNIS